MGASSSLRGLTLAASWLLLTAAASADERVAGHMGHSEGGAIAAIVASQREEVAFVVLWPAPGWRAPS